MICPICTNNKIIKTDDIYICKSCGNGWDHLAPLNTEIDYLLCNIFDITMDELDNIPLNMINWLRNNIILK